MVIDSQSDWSVHSNHPNSYKHAGNHFKSTVHNIETKKKCIGCYGVEPFV